MVSLNCEPLKSATLKGNIWLDFLFHFGVCWVPQTTRSSQMLLFNVADSKGSQFSDTLPVIQFKAFSERINVSDGEASKTRIRAVNSHSGLTR